MSMLARHWHPRDVRFIGLIAMTALLIALHLGEGLRLAAREGSGHRVIDLKALERRIDTGDLSDREADWYHPARPEESGGGAP
jgi:hypothetical protein